MLENQFHKGSCREFPFRKRKKVTFYVLRPLQGGTFAEEYESLEKGDKKKYHLIDQLNLYLDKRLIRCKDWLEKADLPEETKFPLLLPKR